jgi:predicted component of type VI protein secretion system
MRHSHAYQLIPMVAFAVACTGHARDEPGERVARALTSMLGEAAAPQVAFVRDSSHLRVQLSTVAFPTVSEEELTKQAGRIAGSALRNYDKADQLDSVTVVYREPVRPGMWWIRHSRTFSVASLRNGHPGMGASLPAPLTGPEAPKHRVAADAMIVVDTNVIAYLLIPGQLESAREPPSPFVGAP